MVVYTVLFFLFIVINEVLLFLSEVWVVVVEEHIFPAILKEMTFLSHLDTLSY